MSLAALRACLVAARAVGARKTFGGSWRLGRGVFGAELLYAGIRGVESVSLAKLEGGCCSGAESGDGQIGLGFPRAVARAKDLTPTRLIA